MCIFSSHRIRIFSKLARVSVGAMHLVVPEQWASMIFNLLILTRGTGSSTANREVRTAKRGILRFINFMFGCCASS